MNAAQTLTEHAATLRWEAIPIEARSAAKSFLHDSMAVGIAGVRAPYVDTVLAAAEGWSGRGGRCRLLGRAQLLPACDAAFVNAFQIHSQEYDCVHEPAVVHPLATIVAVLLAEVDRGKRVSGPQLLTALVAGVDVAAALGLAAVTPLRFFRPATAGIFGSVAALVNLRSETADIARNAFGCALAFASGTMQAHVEGKPTLPLQIAQAARSAIQAIDLANAGLPAPYDSIEGPFGYLTLFESEYDVSRMRLGDGHRIVEVSWKPFPTGRAAHGAIVATQTLMRDNGVTADNLERLTYRAPSLIHRLVGRSALPDMAPAYARLCVPWLAAVVLTKGTVGLDHFDDETRRDPKLLALAQCVTVEVDDNPDPAAFTPAIATAKLKDGSVYRVTIDAQFGSPRWPLTRDQNLTKARNCLAFAGLASLHAPLTEWIDHLDDEIDVAASLNAVLRPPTH